MKTYYIEVEVWYYDKPFTNMLTISVSNDDDFEKQIDDFLAKKYESKNYMLTKIELINVDYTQEFNELKKEINELKEMIMYLPSVGPKYLEAKQDFENKIEK